MAGFSLNLMPSDEDESISALKDGPEFEQVMENSLHLLQGPVFSDEESTEGPLKPEQQLRDQIAALHKNYHPRVHRYLRSLNVSPQEIEEIIQEVFLRLMIELSKGRQIDKPEGWVIRVAHNLAVALGRRNAMQRGEDTEADDEGAALVDHADTSPNQEERYLQEERNRCLRDALMNTQPQHRNCFLMRLQGLRYQDIGKAMGISEQRAAMIVKTVAMRLAVICG